MTREHFQMKSQLGAKAAMKKALRGWEKRFRKRIATFPNGEFVLMVRCTTEDGRTHTIREYTDVIGTGVLFEAVQQHRETIFQYTGIQQDTMDDIPSENTRKAQYFADIPTSAVPRATKLREMLRLLWKFEGLGDTKQIYKAKAKGQGEFAWWNEHFPDIEFTNDAVGNAEASSRIYAFVLPRLYTHLTGRSLHEPEATTPSEDPPREHEQCTRSHLCTRSNGHVGRCNARRALPSVEEEPPQIEAPPPPMPVMNVDQFRARLEELAHKDEPFKLLNASQIAQLKAHMEQGLQRSDAYKRLGVVVTPDYELWLRTSTGVQAWDTLSREFPDHLAVLSCVITRTRPLEPKRKRKKKKKAKSDKTAKTVKTFNPNRKTFHGRQARAAHKRMVAMDGYHILPTQSTIRLIAQRPHITSA